MALPVNTKENEETYSRGWRWTRNEIEGTHRYLTANARAWYWCDTNH
jgi:endo-1,4-beta-D-glucanase Y